MTRLLVEVEDFVDAARIMFDRVGEPARVSAGRLSEALAASSAMAGDDPGGLSWARSYDGAARSTVEATQQIVDAAYTTSSMFGRSGMNYAGAEAASIASGSQPAAASSLLARLPPTSFSGPALVPPSASGGSSDHPHGWWLVEHTVGYVWPNGHQDRLHAAGAAWWASAAALDEVAFEPIVAGVGFARDRLPEADDILTVCRGLNGHLQDLAAAHRSLAEACTGLARHIDECHSTVEHELVELLAWSAGVQTVGAVASVLSLGAAEAPTQAAQAAKIAEVAARIGVLIRRFTTAAETVAAIIDPIAFATERIRTALESLAATRLVAAGVTAVPAITRTARVAKDGVRLSKAARAEVAATERLAKGPVSLARKPPLPNIDDPKRFDPQTLKGMNADEVGARIPRNWTRQLSKRGDGVVYRDPLNRGRQIRVMNGYPKGSRPDLVTTGPYVVVSQGGTGKLKIPLEGNPSI